MWYHLQPTPGAARIENAAWCYPEPTAGRENLRDHVTFATGKGIAIGEPKARPTVAEPLERKGTGGDGGGGRDSHDSQELRSRHAPASGSSSAPSMIPAETPLFPVLSSHIHFGEHSTRFLELANSDTTVLCHTNCGRPAQGTAFFDPPFLAGHCYRLRIRIDSKPGRMCYFIGVRDFPCRAHTQRQLHARLPPLPVVHNRTFHPKYCLVRWRRSGSTLTWGRRQSVPRPTRSKTCGECTAAAGHVLCVFRQLRY